MCTMAFSSVMNFYFRLSAKKSLCRSVLIKQFSNSKSFEAKAKSDPPNGITVSRDGSTIVCWHPEQPFPYEFSKPLPEHKPVEANSVLKVQCKDEVMNVFKAKPQQYVYEDLMKLTYTSIHRWTPRSRDKKAKKTPPDREYL